MPTHHTFRSVRPEDECFADEVAIDFRSLASVVDRMRASFFASEEEPPAPTPRASRPARGLGGRSDS
jgi:hypothetical protein